MLCSSGFGAKKAPAVVLLQSPVRFDTSASDPNGSERDAQRRDPLPKTRGFPTASATPAKMHTRGPTRTTRDAMPRHFRQLSMRGAEVQKASSLQVHFLPPNEQVIFLPLQNLDVSGLKRQSAQRLCSVNQVMLIESETLAQLSDNRISRPGDVRPELFLTIPLAPRDPVRGQRIKSSGHCFATSQDAPKCSGRLRRTDARPTTIP